jgi:type II secretory pathway pseudopilin PulG
MRRPVCFPAALLACVIACGVALTSRAQDLSADDILPDNTVAAFVIPDLAAARAQAGKTKLGEMFAQPEMQEFLRPILRELRTQYDAVRQANPMIVALEDLDASLFSAELAIGVRPLPDNPRNVVSVWVMLRPKDMAALLRTFIPPIRERIQDGKPMPLGPNGPVMVLTKDRLLFCTDQADFDVLVARAQATAPAADSLAKAPGYAAVKAASPTAAGWLYFAPDGLLNVIHRGMKDVAHIPEADKYKAAAQVLGVDSVSAWFAALSFRNGLPVLEGSMRLKKEAAEGALAVFVPPPAFSPKPEAFAIAAPDAPFVSAGYINAAVIVPLIRQCVQAISPANVAQFDGVLEMARQTLRCDLQKDVLENVGAEFVAAQTPTDTAMPMSMMPGMVYSFPVKDPARFEAALKRIGAFLAALPPPIATQYHFKTITIAGNPVYYVVGMLAPASPIFTLVKGRLLMGTSVNAVRRVLEQLNAPANILSNAAFQQTIARVTGKPFDPAHLPASFSYATDESSGTGSLLLTGAYVAAAGGMIAGLAELPVPGRPPMPAFGRGGNPALEFLMRPAGQVVLPLASAVDLALWPDETFFHKYRMATALCSEVEAGVVRSRVELPMPGPTGMSMSLTTTTAGVAIVAAIAIPSLLRSRMAANQTAAAAGCKAYAEAQEIYHRTDYDGDGVLEYAQALGGDNSLLEKKAGAGDLALIDRNFANAEAGPGRQPVPKAGYYFKVLKAQGPGATGGKRSYITKAGNAEHMTLGYGLVAYPAAYDGTGRDTFIINNNGTIFQADLGPESSAIVEKMTEFDPKFNGIDWVPAE